MHRKEPNPRILVHHNTPIVIIGNFPIAPMVGKETPERKGRLQRGLVVKHQPEVKTSKEEQRYGKGKRKDGRDKHVRREGNRRSPTIAAEKTGENHIHREEEDQKRSHPAVEQKENKEFLVLVTDAIAHPRTMVIHVHNAHFAYTAVVTAWRFLLAAHLTVAHTKGPVHFIVVMQIGCRYGSRMSKNTFQVAPYTQDVTYHKET